MHQYFIVALLGTLLGGAEIISRYRDDPKALLSMPAAYLYILFNAGVSCAALYLIGAFPIEDALDTGLDKSRQIATNILIAGFGGAAFFRSSIARIKVGETEIGVGPSFVIDAFLGATDREIDRRRAIARTRRIPELMRDIPPDFAAEALTQYCIGTMQNLSAADEKNLETRSAFILNGDLPPSIRSMLIGMILTEYIGQTVLEEAIKMLSKEIEEAQSERSRLGRQLVEEDLIAALESGGLPGDGEEAADAVDLHPEIVPGREDEDADARSSR